MYVENCLFFLVLSRRGPHGLVSFENKRDSSTLGESDMKLDFFLQEYHSIFFQAAAIERGNSSSKKRTVRSQCKGKLFAEKRLSAGN